MRPAGPQDVRPLSLVLARAFRDDPLHRWILASELHWALASEAFFAMLLRDALREGGVFTTAGLEGAAIWFPPYPAAASPLRRLWTLLRWLALLGRRAPSVAGELARLEGTRPLEPHGYLAVLGTDPRHAGRGVGSALLAHGLARCDADRVPAHLESSKRENLSFYERHGFRTLGAFPLQGGPTVWRMHREVAA